MFPYSYNTRSNGNNSDDTDADEDEDDDADYARLSTDVLASPHLVRPFKHFHRFSLCQLCSPVNHLLNLCAPDQ